MTWYEKIIEMHMSVTDAVSHNQYLKSDRYFVWGERGGNDMQSDDVHSEKSVMGYTDLYTKQEFDPWKDEFEQALDSYGVAWSLNSVQYEEDTGFTHYEWYWEMT